MKKVLFLSFILVLSSLLAFAQEELSWGANESGQMGNGSNTPSTVPAAIPGLTDIIAFSAGTRHTLALKSDGTVWAWGNNDNGQLGDETANPSNTPIQTHGISNVTAIAAQGFYSFALKNDGTVWQWGSLPAQIFTNALAISAGGNHVLALKNDGTVWAWGMNASGQLGTGNTTPSLTPVAVLNLTNVTAISAGWNHSLALKSDGTVWAWGFNTHGELGNGTEDDSNVPVQVLNLSNVKAIETGALHCFALKNDGTVWAWGRNSVGQLGNGGTADSSVPVLVQNLANVASLQGGCGNYHSFVVLKDMTVKTWGDDDNGQCGNGNTVNLTTPIAVDNLIGVTNMGAGSFHSLATGINTTGCPAISLSPATLPAATVGTAYNQTLAGGGGASPYSFSGYTGALPTGLSLAANGVISGTPTAAGVYSFSAVATDNNSCAGISLYLITVNAASCPAITCSPSTLPDGEVGTVYNQTLTGGGGTSPYVFAVTKDSLPPGLVMSAAGVIAGVPAAGCISPFTVTATDTNGCAVSQQYSVTIVVPCPAIAVSPAILPSGSTVIAYNQTISASGGTSPYVFSVSSGSLPAGLTLSGAGILSGTATTAGSYDFTVTVSDFNSCTGSQNYTLKILEPCPTISISPSTLPDALLGAPYSKTITAAGGVSPYSIVLATGNLPPGLALSPAGVISGTPTTIGVYNFQITVTDLKECGVTTFFAINVVCPAISLTPAALPQGITTRSYSQTISAAGGFGSYAYSVYGQLPPGLTLASSGLLSGVPEKAGIYVFSILATDIKGCTGILEYSVQVINPPIIYGISKAADPFRLIVKGTSFFSNADGSAWVYINDQPVPVTSYKSVTKVVAKSGEALKAMLPKGVPVEIRVKNPDGTISDPFVFVR
jgi:alpha-tubulin suppressor-like RCC1 family protein